MAELTLKGNDAYIKRMFKHLKKEHPSTKQRMVMETDMDFADYGIMRNKGISPEKAIRKIVLSKKIKDIIRLK